MKSAAVVVAWRHADVTVQAVAALAAMDPPCDEIVCVAQEFSEAERRELEREGPATLSVLAIDANLGFAAGANRGIDFAIDNGAEAVLLVNSDAFVTRECIGRCLEISSQEGGIAILGPAIAFADREHELWYCGGSFSHLFAIARHPGRKSGRRSLPPTRDTDYVPGCCALISAAAWRDVGPFRADFFMYHEDVEWCERARQRGWRCLYLGEVLCEHAVAASSEQRDSLGLAPDPAYYLARNPLRMALETPTPLLRFSRLLGIATAWNAHNLRRVLQSPTDRRGSARAYAQGLRDAIAARMGPRMPSSPTRAATAQLDGAACDAS